MVNNHNGKWQRTWWIFLSPIPHPSVSLPHTYVFSSLIPSLSLSLLEVFLSISSLSNSSLHYISLSHAKSLSIQRLFSTLIPTLLSINVFKVRYGRSKCSTAWNKWNIMWSHNARLKNKVTYITRPTSSCKITAPSHTNINGSPEPFLCAVKNPF